jgi:hypothetical protein
LTLFQTFCPQRVSSGSVLNGILFFMKKPTPPPPLVFFSRGMIPLKREFHVILHYCLLNSSLYMCSLCGHFRCPHEIFVYFASEVIKLFLCTSRKGLLICLIFTEILCCSQAQILLIEKDLKIVKAVIKRFPKVANSHINRFLKAATGS